jgi:hypothetical protein
MSREIFYRNEKDLQSIISFLSRLLCLLLLFSHCHFIVKLLDELYHCLFFGCEFVNVHLNFIEIVPVKDVEHSAGVKILIGCGKEL